MSNRRLAHAYLLTAEFDGEGVLVADPYPLFPRAYLWAHLDDEIMESVVTNWGNEGIYMQGVGPSLTGVPVPGLWPLQPIGLGGALYFDANGNLSYDPTNIETQLAALQGTITALQNQLAGDEALIASLQSTMANQQGQITSLQATVASQQNQINVIIATARFFPFGVASLVGTGSLTVPLIQRQPITMALAGAGALNFDLTRIKDLGTVAMSASGGIRVDFSGPRQATAQFAGNGILTMAPVTQRPTSISLAGFAQMSIAETMVLPTGRLPFSSTGSMVVDVDNLLTITPLAMASSGSLTATTLTKLLPATGFNGLGNVATGLVQYQGLPLPLLAGASSSTVQEQMSLVAASSLSSSSTTASALRQQMSAVPLLLGASGLVSGSTQWMTAQTTLAGAGGLNAAFAQTVAWSAIAAFSGNGIASSSLIQRATVQALTAGSGVLGVQEQMRLPLGIVGLIGTGSLSVIPAFNSPLVSSLAGIGGAAAISLNNLEGMTSSLAGASGSVVAETFIANIASTLAGASTLVGDVPKYVAFTLWSANANLAGGSGMSVINLLKRIPNTTYAGAGTWGSVNYSNACLLLPFDTGPYDITGIHNPTQTNVTYTSVTKKFGANAAVFGNTNSYPSTGSFITVSDKLSNFNFDSDFTIDFWFYPTDLSQGACFFGTGANDAIALYCTSAGNVTVVFGTTGGVAINGQSTITTGTWNHIALTRASGSTTLFVAGVVQSQAISGDANHYDPNPGDSIIIGAPPTGSAYLKGFYTAGYIDEFRVINGSAAWTTTFTPPSTAYAAALNRPNVNRVPQLITSGWDVNNTSPSLTLTNNNYTATATASGAYQNARGTKYQAGGYYYFEQTINAFGAGDFMVGGIVNISFSPTTAAYVGVDGYGTAVYAPSGGAYAAYFNGGSQFTMTGVPAVGDVIMTAIDIANGFVWFGLNGAWARGVTPTTTATGGDVNMGGSIYFYPACTCDYVNSKITLDTGHALKYPIPTGFSAWT